MAKRSRLSAKVFLGLWRSADGALSAATVMCVGLVCSAMAVTGDGVDLARVLRALKTSKASLLSVKSLSGRLLALSFLVDRIAYQITLISSV